MRRAKVDTNHAEIVQALRAAGCSVQSLARVMGGCPDLLVGYGGMNFLFEVKAGRGKLRDNQVAWREGWKGQSAVVRSASEAIFTIGFAIDPQMTIK